MCLKWPLAWSLRSRVVEGMCVWYHCVSGWERTLSWSQRNQTWFFSLHCLSAIVWLFHFSEGKFRALRPGYCFREEKYANYRDGVGLRALLPQAQWPPWCVEMTFLDYLEFSSWEVSRAYWRLGGGWWRGLRTQEQGGCSGRWGASAGPWEALMDGASWV